MVPPDLVGRTGRALTEIGAAGRVEVDGRWYDAATSRAPIPAQEMVEVTGWRLVGDAGYVLSVRRPGDTAPPLATEVDRPALNAHTVPSARETEHEAQRRAWDRLAYLCVAELQSLTGALRWIGALTALPLVILVLCPPKLALLPAYHAAARAGHSFGWDLDQPNVATDWVLLVAELALILAAAALAAVLVLVNRVTTVLRTIGRGTT